MWGQGDFGVYIPYMSRAIILNSHVLDAKYMRFSGNWSWEVPSLYSLCPALSRYLPFCTTPKEGFPCIFPLMKEYSPQDTHMTLPFISTLLSVS